LPRQQSDRRLGRLVVITRRVDDPYNEAGRLLVDAHVHESPIEYLRAHHLIDQARLAVADAFRGLHERIAIGDSQAIDYTRVKIDHAFPHDPITDETLQAARELRRVAEQIGWHEVHFLAEMIDHRRRFGDVVAHYAGLYGMPARAAHGFVRGRLCEALDRLGVFWGMILGTGERRPSAAVPVDFRGYNAEAKITIHDPRG
jgi:hypothetical protein